MHLLRHGHESMESTDERPELTRIAADISGAAAVRADKYPTRRASFRFGRCPEAAAAAVVRE